MFSCFEVHMPPMIVFAPSSSGKTFFADHFPERVVDGDTVISHAHAWPKEARWWERADARKVHEAHIRLLLAHALANPDRAVLFNTDPTAVDLDLLASAGVGVEVVLPPLDIVLRNVERKAAAQERGLFQGQPVDHDTIVANWHAWRDWARTHHVPIREEFSHR